MDLPEDVEEGPRQHLGDVLMNLSQINLSFLCDIEKMRSWAHKQGSERSVPYDGGIKQEVRRRIRKHAKDLVAIVGQADLDKGNPTNTNEAPIPELDDGHATPSSLCNHMLLESLEFPPQRVPVFSASEETSSMLIDNSEPNTNVLPRPSFALLDFQLKAAPSETRSAIENGEEAHSYCCKKKTNTDTEVDKLLPPGKQVSAREGFFYEQNVLRQTTFKGQPDANTGLHPDSESEYSDQEAISEDDGYTAGSDNGDCSMQDVAIWGESSDTDGDTSDPSTQKIEQPLFSPYSSGEDDLMSLTGGESVDYSSKEHNIQEKTPPPRRYTGKSTENGGLRYETKHLRVVRARGYGANFLGKNHRLDLPPEEPSQSDEEIDSDDESISDKDCLIPAYKRYARNDSPEEHFARFLKERANKWDPLTESERQAYLERHSKGWKCFYCQILDLSGGCISQVSHRTCIITARRGVPCQISKYDDEAGAYRWCTLSGMRKKLKFKNVNDSYRFVCGQADSVIEQKFLQQMYQTRFRCISCVLSTRKSTKGDRCNLQKRIRACGLDGGLLRACKKCERLGSPGNCMVAVPMTYDLDGKPLTYGLGIVPSEVEGNVEMNGPRFPGDCANSLLSPTNNGTTLSHLGDCNASSEQEKIPKATEDNGAIHKRPNTLLPTRALSRLADVPQATTFPGPPFKLQDKKLEEVFKDATFRKSGTLRLYCSAQNLSPPSAERTHKRTASNPGLLSVAGANPGYLSLATGSRNQENESPKRQLTPPIKVKEDHKPFKMRRLPSSQGISYLDRVTKIWESEVNKAAIDNAKPKPPPRPEVRRKYKY